MADEDDASEAAEMFGALTGQLGERYIDYLSTMTPAVPKPVSSRDRIVLESFSEEDVKMYEDLRAAEKRVSKLAQELRNTLERKKALRSLMWSSIRSRLSSLDIPGALTDDMELRKRNDTYCVVLSKSKGHG